jgi:large subunit ribosomal protein L22
MDTVEKKTKRSVLKREKRDARKEAAKTGPSVAKLKNVPTSPRKMRLVADLIRGERVSKALNILKYEPKVGAPKLEKLLLSAISSWEAKHEDVKLEDADLYVKDIWVDGGGAEKLGEAGVRRRAGNSLSNEAFSYKRGGGGIGNASVIGLEFEEGESDLLGLFSAQTRFDIW